MQHTRSIDAGPGARSKPPAMAGVMGLFEPAKQVWMATPEADPTQNPVWAAMMAVAEKTGKPTHYRSDLQIDRTTVHEWRGLTDFLWVLRDTGTSLIPLDMDWSRREARATLAAFNPESSNAGNQVFLVGTRLSGKPSCKEISWLRAQAMTGPERGSVGTGYRRPVYSLDHAARAIRHHDRSVLATIEVDEKARHPHSWDHATVIVNLTDAGYASESPVMISAAFAFLAHYTGTLFVSPGRILVLDHRGSTVDTYVSKRFTRTGCAEGSSC